MLEEGFKLKFSKLGPTNKNGPMRKFLKIFHSESIEMDDKQYNDPICIKI